MTAKPKPQVRAIGSHRALKLAQKVLREDVHIVRAQPAHELRMGAADLALADLRFGRLRVVRLLRTPSAVPRPAAFVDVDRLTRQYGKRVATEVLRQVVTTRLAESHSAR